MKALNKGCGSHGLGLELRVELAAQEPRVVPEFDDLDEPVFGVLPGKDEPGLGQGLLVFRVELVAVTVPLVDGQDSR